MNSNFAVSGKLKSYDGDAVDLAPCRTTIPLVEHLAMVNGRLEGIEISLNVVQRWIDGPRPECDESCSNGEDNLESQIFRAERIANRLEELVSAIRNRIS